LRSGSFDRRNCWSTRPEFMSGGSKVYPGGNLGNASGVGKREFRFGRSPTIGRNSATIAKRSRHREGLRQVRKPELSRERWALIAAVHSFYPERPNTHLVVLHVNNQTVRIPFGECRKMQTGWPRPSVEPQKHAPIW